MHISLGPFTFTYKPTKKLEKEAVKLLKETHELLALGPDRVGGERRWNKLEWIALDLEGRLIKREANLDTVIPYPFLQQMWRGKPRPARPSYK